MLGPNMLNSQMTCIVFKNQLAGNSGVVYEKLNSGQYSYSDYFLLYYIANINWIRFAQAKTEDGQATKKHWFFFFIRHLVTQVFSNGCQLL